MHSGPCFDTPSRRFGGHHSTVVCRLASLRVLLSFAFAPSSFHVEATVVHGFIEKFMTDTFTVIDRSSSTQSGGYEVQPTSSIPPSQFESIHL